MGSERREMLPHGEIGKTLTTFGDNRQTQTCDTVRIPARNALPFKSQRASRERNLAKQRFDQRAFAHTIAPQQSDDFASLNIKRDIE